MSADFERVAELFERARHLDGAEREALLADAGGEDTELRREVEELLAHEGGDDVMSDDELDRVRRRLSHVASGEGLAPELDEETALPTRIGEFTVVRRLGAGGMGVVYEALQTNPRRSVAVKLLRPTLLSGAVRKRFEREAEILARLRHPGIAQVYETGTCDLGDGPQPYFAMELVEGRSLGEHVRAAGLDLRARVDLVRSLCDAMHHAHTQGVVHRDLKPDNVLVDAAGRTRILDFGVGHVALGEDGSGTLHTGDGEFVGTLEYMAPEQVSGGEAARAPSVDVYALGAILFELVAGRTPHELGDQPLVRAARTVAEEDAPSLRRVLPSVPADLAVVVDRALAPDPTRRYGSALELSSELGRFLADEPVRARPASALYLAERFVRRNAYLTAGVAVAFVGLVIGLVVSVLQTQQANVARAEAQRQAENASAVNEFLVERLLTSPAPRELGRDVKVVDVLDLAAPAIDDTFTGQPEVAASVRAALGRAYLQLGRRDEALAQLERASAELTALLGAQHPDVIDAARWHAVALAEAGRVEEAREATVEAIERATAREPDAPASVEDESATAELLELRSMNARTTFQQGQRDLALREGRAALEEADRLLGVHDATVGIVYDLAVMLSDGGQLAEAEALAWRYLEDVRELHGDDDAREVLGLHLLAGIRAELGDWREAVDLARDAVARAHEGYGPEHPTTLSASGQLAELLSEHGDPNEAREAFVECIELHRRILGDDHQYTLRHLSNFTVHLRRTGALDEALPLAYEVLDRRRAALGPTHPDVAISLDVLAVVHFERDELDEAEAAFLEGLAIARDFFGDGAPEVADILHNLAALSSRRGTLLAPGDERNAHLREAERRYQELYEIELGLYGADHPFPLVDRLCVGRAVSLQGEHQRAVEILREVEAEQARLLAFPHEEHGATLAWLGRSLVELGRREQAIEALDRSLAHLEELGRESTISKLQIREYLERARELDE